LIQIHLAVLIITLNHQTLEARQVFYLVPSARLELAQLSPLPPQDSVSTNFTTTAVFSCPDRMRNLQGLSLSELLRVYPENTSIPGPNRIISAWSACYFPGICAAPEAGATGTGTTAAGEFPGIWAEGPEAAGMGAGVVTAARSSTLPLEAGRTLPK
jgi:hypothetical protein